MPNEEVQRKKMEEQQSTVLLMQKVFNSPDGKGVLEKISEMCNENEPTYVDKNPNGSAYKEGQRSIIIGIRKMLNKTFEPKQGKAEL